MGHGRGGAWCGGTLWREGTRWAGGWLLQVQRGQMGSPPTSLACLQRRSGWALAGLGRLPGRWTVLATGLELRSFLLPSSPGLEAALGWADTVSRGAGGTPVAELHHSILVTCHPFPRGGAGRGGGGQRMGRWSGPLNTEEVAWGLGGCRRKGCPRPSGELLQGSVGRTPGPCVQKGLRLRRGAGPEAPWAEAGSAHARR